MGDWLGLGMAVLSLGASLTLLTLQRRQGRRLRQAAQLVPEWRAMAARWEAAGEKDAAEALRFAAYWLGDRLTGGPGIARGRTTP